MPEKKIESKEHERFCVGYVHPDMFVEVKVLFRVNGNKDVMEREYREDIESASQHFMKKLERCTKDWDWVNYWKAVEEAMESERIHAGEDTECADKQESESAGEPKETRRPKNREEYDVYQDWGSMPSDGDYHGWGGIPDD